MGMKLDTFSTKFNWPKMVKIQRKNAFCEKGPPNKKDIKIKLWMATL